VLLKELLLASAFGAALAGGAGLAATARLAPLAPKQTTPKPATKSTDGDAKSTQHDGAAAKTNDAKPKTNDAKSNANDAKSKAGVAKTKVTEIKEAELKSLLGVGEGRVRPLLVNFWATWCAPCREEFPDLVKIRKQYATDRLDFVIISLDDPSDIQKAVPEFLKEVRATSFPAYLLHADDDGAVINLVDPTWHGELPATFLYDREGRLVFKHKGRISPADLRAALDQTLSAKPLQAGAQRP
jgi:thiol-disulfide isomerase/thioredoxin